MTANTFFNRLAWTVALCFVLGFGFLGRAQSTMKLGAYYMMSEVQDDGSLGAPWPYDPYPGLTAKPLGNGAYLIDDTAVAAAKLLLEQQSASTTANPPLPGSGTMSGSGGTLIPFTPASY